jgi:hypothetical protein
MAEEGIPLKDIADVIGRKLNLPVVTKRNKEAAKHFGFLAEFFSADNLASSQWTQDQLGWNPTHPGLLEDPENGSYFEFSSQAVKTEGPEA